jgi:predicted transcriptional regulator
VSGIEAVSGRVTKTYSLAEAAALIPCNEQWLVRQLRAGRFTASKIARNWRLTDADIENVIQTCRYTAPSGEKIPELGVGMLRHGKRRVI